MIRVTVWNEFRHEQTDEKVKVIYPKGIHECIADFLGKDTELSVRTATLDMPEHGLTEDILSETDVLVFWNHMFQDEFQDEIAERVQNHVLAGMGLVVLHSGHFSKIMKRLLGTTMTLRWRHGDRERLFCTCPAHPIAQGIPPFFDIPEEEMYGAFFGRGGLAGMELSVFYDHILEAAHQTDKSTSEILKYCHDIGINGLEMNFSFLDENKEAVCSELSDSGMKISCLYEMFDFGRNKDTSKGKRMIEAALEMKAPNILVVPGEMESWEAAELSACSDAYDTAEQYMDQSASIQNMKCALTELVGYAAKTGIQVTLEDFDGFMQPFARMNQLLWFMKHVRGLKYTLDMGNFAFSNEDVVKAADVLKEYIVHVHCKDRRESRYVKGEFCRGLGQCAAGEGYIPIDSLVKRLKESGYNGYLAIEHFGVQNQISYIEKSADYLKKLISA